MGTFFYVTNAVLAVACLIGFATAIVHARDNVDRLYLVGGALMLAVVVGSGVARWQEPFNWRLPLVLAAQIVWIISAGKSRARRRNRLAQQ